MKGRHCIRDLRRCKETEKIKHEIESVRMCDRLRVPAGMIWWVEREEFLQNTGAYLFPRGTWRKAPPQADMAVNFKGHLMRIQGWSLPQIPEALWWWRYLCDVLWCVANLLTWCLITLHCAGAPGVNSWQESPGDSVTSSHHRAYHSHSSWPITESMGSISTN